MKLGMVEREGQSPHTSSMANPKRPRDPNQLAKLITDLAVGDAKESHPDIAKNPDAIARGRKGGKQGGKKRMNALTEDQRRELALRAAAIRWKKGAPSKDGAPAKGQLNKSS